MMMMIFSQSYGQNEEGFRALTKNNILQPYFCGTNFRSLNIRAEDFGYILYVSDIRYQQKFTASQPIKVEYKFEGVVSNVANGYALVLTNKLVTVSSDGRRHFDLI